MNAAVSLLFIKVRLSHSTRHLHWLNVPEHRLNSSDVHSFDFSSAYDVTLSLMDTLIDVHVHDRRFQCIHHLYI